MDKTKAWWQSKTIWASIMQFLIGVATSAGWINDAAGQVVIAEGPGVIIGFVTAALGALSLYGRVKATKEIGEA